MMTLYQLQVMPTENRGKKVLELHSEKAQVVDSLNHECP